MNKSESKYFHTAAKMDEALLRLLEKKDLEYITVKEICETAGVNRSTFYLHYETIADLLEECVALKNKQCFTRYSQALTEVSDRLASANLEELIFITPEYLRPYFTFVRENQRLFKVALSHPAALPTDQVFRTLFQNVFSPILGRFRMQDAIQPYIIRFYLSGLMAIVAEWIKQDCQTPIEEIVGICMQCILPKGPAGVRDET